MSIKSISEITDEIQECNNDDNRTKLIDTYIDILKKDGRCLGKSIGLIEDKDTKMIYTDNYKDNLGPIGIFSIIKQMQNDGDKKEWIGKYINILKYDSFIFGMSIGELDFFFDVMCCVKDLHKYYVDAYLSKLELGVSFICGIVHSRKNDSDKILFIDEYINILKRDINALVKSIGEIKSLKLLIENINKYESYFLPNSVNFVLDIILLRENDEDKKALIEVYFNALKNEGQLGNAIKSINDLTITIECVNEYLSDLNVFDIYRIVRSRNNDADKKVLIHKYCEILKESHLGVSIGLIEDKRIRDDLIKTYKEDFNPKDIYDIVCQLKNDIDKEELIDSNIQILENDSFILGQSIGEINKLETIIKYVDEYQSSLGPKGIYGILLVRSKFFDAFGMVLFNKYIDILKNDSFVFGMSIGYIYDLESIVKYVDDYQSNLGSRGIYGVICSMINDNEKKLLIEQYFDMLVEDSNYLISAVKCISDETIRESIAISHPKVLKKGITSHKAKGFEILDETQIKPVQVSWKIDNDELQTDKVLAHNQASDSSIIDEFSDDSMSSNDNNPSIEESVEQEKSDSQQEEGFITRIKSVFANIFTDTEEELTTEAKRPVSVAEESSDEEIVFAQAQPRKKISLPQIRARELFSGIEKAKKDSGGLLLSSKDLLTGYYLFEEEPSKDEENGEELLYPTYNDSDFYHDEVSEDYTEIVEDEDDIALQENNHESFFQTVKRKFNMFILHKDVQEDEISYDSIFGDPSIYSNVVVADEECQPKVSFFQKMRRLFKDSKHSEKQEPIYDSIFGGSRNNEFVFPPSDEDDYVEETIIDTPVISDEQGSDKLKSELYQRFVNALNNRIISLEDIKKKSCLPTKINSIIDIVKSSFAGKPTIKESTDKIFKIVKARKPKNKFVLSKKVVTVSLTLALILSSTAIALTHNFNANKSEEVSQPILTANDVIVACDLARNDDLNKMVMDSQAKENISSNNQKVEQNNESEKKNDSAQVDNKQEEEIIINIGDIVTVDADYIYTDVYKAKDKVDGEKPYFENSKERNVKGILFTLDGDNVYCTTRDEIKNTFDAGGIAQSYVVGDENGYEGAYNAEDVVFVESADGYDFVKTDEVKVLYRM